MNKKDDNYIQKIIDVILPLYKNQKTLAAFMGIPPATLSAIINRNRTATASFKKRIYNLIKYDKRLSDEEINFFKQAYLSDYDLNTEVDELLQSLKSNILNSSEYLNSNNENPLLNIFLDLLDDMNNLKFSIGGLNIQDEYNITNSILSHLRYNLSNYMSNNMFSNISTFDRMTVRFNKFKEPLLESHLVDVNQSYIGIITGILTHLSLIPINQYYYVEQITKNTLLNHLDILLCELTSVANGEKYHIPLRLLSQYSTTLVSSIDPYKLSYQENNEWFNLDQLILNGQYSIDIIGRLALM